ncbi:hypothetical protein CAEBREN_28267 [Caenorhabditis brenneri]|uniref:Uncharacterized protein n=1 Tax=Caenorhabditis brenneri TaxID=135651 RepID=G0NW91_CAEBE|nr:hypothetical protein CAEBREN_28267 [Caenorhabditis brenneri]
MNERDLTLRLCRELQVSANILHNPEELFAYAERIPPIAQWDHQHLLNDPLEKNGLLFSLRAEKLPNIAIYFKDVARREMYLMNNGEFFDWVASMAEGAVPERAPRSDGVTARCPACASSFFGFPLTDHKHQDCGFVHLVEPEFVLPLLVANSHSLCGYCNSKSTHHYECRNPRRCGRCNREGHQEFHMVCDTEWGATPIAFKNQCRALRIEHLDRVKFGIASKRIAIPVPTDHVPRRINAGLRRHQPIRGAGPLVGPIAEVYAPIPEQVYQWKSYPGLVDVASDVEHVLRPWDLTDEECRMFMRLERRARDTYNRLANDFHRPHYIFHHCFGLPAPEYPANMPNPGGPPMAPPIQPEAAVVPAPAPQPQIVEAEVQADLDVEPEDARSVASEQESYERRVASEAEITELAAIVQEPLLLIRNPIRPFLDELVDSCTLYAEGHIFVIVSVLTELNLYFSDSPLDGEERIEDVHLYFERKLLKLVHEAVEKWFVATKEDTYSYHVPPEVVNKLAAQVIPNSTHIYVKRIDTWIMALTGTSEQDKHWHGNISDEKIRSYHDFLVKLATTLCEKPDCYKQLGSSQEYENTRLSSIQLIPTIHEFEYEHVQNKIQGWLDATPTDFALFQMNTLNFPLNATVIRSNYEKTEEEEIEMESKIQRVINVLDPDPSTLDVRISMPSLEVFDHLLGIQTPRMKSPLVTRLETIQRVMTGAYEDNMEKFEEDQLRQYHALWVAMMQPMRTLVTLGLSSPSKLSDCKHELIQGMTHAFGLAIPSCEIFNQETYGFWKSWIKETLIPAISRIAATSCDCIEHLDLEENVENQEDQEDQED